MTIHFYLKYHTEFGQALYIFGNNDFLGNNDAAAAVELSYFNNDYWHLKIDFPKNFDDIVLYKYFLKDKDGSGIFDGEESRAIDLSLIRVEAVSVFDTWNDASNSANVFFTRAFSKVLLPGVIKVKPEFPISFTHEFRVKALLLQPGETICMCGSTENLKNWSTTDPILFTPANNWFVGRAHIRANEWPASYKYGIYNAEQKKIVRFEEGENRILQKIEKKTTLTIIHDGFVQSPVVNWKGAGVAIPVFSLRSKKSFGVGEFTDIPLLIDWAKQTGLQLVQLLPVNDTTARNSWHDSYPYAAISAFALHPLYVNLEKIAGKNHMDIVKPLKKKQKQLNELSVFDYEQVMKFKWSILKELYLAMKDTLKSDVVYFEFFELNRHWLVPYAAFSYLRNKNNTADFNQWKNHKVYNESEVQKLVSPSRSHYDEVAFFYFVQYHLHLQLKSAVDYAHRHKIVLKGDIPIGIHRYGCDAWANPSLYNLDEQSGAPPDDFSVKGQNWGFPTYNWSKMKEDGFKWWRLRFDQMSNYFDAFRIDHILGFFRIWSIPLHAVEGILGRFVPAIPIHISEFKSRDIWFDYDRYCKPFITSEVLSAACNENAEYIKSHFLEPFLNGQLRLKEEFNTQVKVARYFIQNDFGSSETIQQCLFDLISNVILLEEENSGSTQFHFRIGMKDTSSFQHLDNDTRDRLQELYINYFYYRQDDFWRKEALKKLPQLKRSTNMLICGEDLGMVPHCVPEVMKQLGILSLEIQRMPKDPKTEFFHPNDSPYLAVVTPSTHDMSTIRGWWEEDRGKTERFYKYMLGHYGQAPYFCEAWINKEIILQHLYSPAMWSIFLLQDMLGINEKIRRENPNDERINIPSNPNHYWQYRMHLNLEDLLKETEFNAGIKKYVKESGRTPAPALKAEG
ncbi:MAG: 4-alpha-glucanotransferase [Ginsengibacter sp.]